MRGKGRQLSVLHVYHHVTIFLMYWLNMKTLYDGDVYFTILLNAFIHAVMYTYYFITLQIPKRGKKPIFKLWWKKHTTQLQMLQFTMMVAQSVYSHYMTCPVYSKRHNLIYGVY